MLKINKQFQLLPGLKSGVSLKFHEFQSLLQRRPPPKKRYFLDGDAAKFNFSDYEGLEPGLLQKDIEEAWDDRHEIYVYRDGYIWLLGSRGYGKEPWRRKIGSGYYYFSKLKVALNTR